MRNTFTKTMILITIILMDLLSGMEFDLFVPSFPELQNDFNLSPFWVEALLSMNFVGYCLGLFFVGGLADRFGRRPVIVLDLTIFVIGSIMCLVANNYSFLLLGRFLQGLGVAAPSILSFLIIADSYPMHKQQFLLTILNGIMNVSIGIAPIIGSYLTLFFHWQGNFVALLIVGIVTLVMSLLFIPNYKLPEHKDSFLFKGYISIFKSKPLMLLITSFAFIIAPYWIFVGISPLLYMEDLGVSLEYFGYYQGSLALVFALGCFSYGMIIKRFNQQKMLYLSGLMLCSGIIITAWLAVSNNTNPLLITLSMLPLVIGQIVPSTVIYPLCINYLPHAKGRIAASIQGLRLVLSAFGLQLAGYYYQSSFRSPGIILCGFMIIAAVTYFAILKNRDIMLHSTPG